MPVDRLIHPRLGDSEKVAKLTDLEFRVWITYLLAADDFGVLPLVASKIQGADRTLGNRRGVQVVRALESAVAIDLVQAFDHQGALYVWSATWQTHQRIRFPRLQTHYPAPHDATLRALTHPDTAPTRDLFATFHPRVSEAFRAEFGDLETLAVIAEREQKRKLKKPRRSGDVSETDLKQIGSVSTHTRAGARETANTQRLPADVVLSEGMQGEPFDGGAALHALQHRRYPSHRVTRNARTQHAFNEAIFGHPDGPAAAWALFCDNLEANIESHEWRVKGMVPWLERYIVDGLWLNRQPAAAPAGERVSKQTSTTLSAMGDILGSKAS